MRKAQSISPTRTIQHISPTRTVQAIIGINVLFFVVSLILSGKQADYTLSPFRALSPSLNALIFMGASGVSPIAQYHQWWSLITANWLHGSLIHILFNMAALFHIGRLIIVTYGFNRMVIIYTVSGIAGFYLSYVAHVPVTIGASASLCGLIGAAFYYGKTQPGPFAKMVRETSSGWILSLIIFGIALPNINNWGHGGGLATGAFLAWLMGYFERGAETLIHRISAWICIIGTLITLGWVLLSALTTLL